MSQTEFAVIFDLDGTLDWRMCGQLLPRGAVVCAIVDRMRGTWTGFAPWPHTEREIGVIAADALEWPIGNDLCSAHRDIPIITPFATRSRRVRADASAAQPCAEERRCGREPSE